MLFVHELWRLAGVLGRHKHEPRLSELLRCSILQFSSGALFRVVLGRNVAVTPTDYAHVDVACRDVIQALVERSIVARDIVLHRDHIMPEPAKGLVGRLAIAF